MMEQILDTWDISNRITLFLLGALPPEALAVRASGRSRTVGDEFAHLHHVRLMWLKSAAPDRVAPAPIDKEAALVPQALADGLTASAAALRAVVQEALEKDGRIRGFKPHATAFVGYLIAHEAHHRGRITLVLKQAGLPVDKKTLFGMWEWGVR